MNPISDLTLSDYLRIIRKHKEIIIICFLMVIAAVWLNTKREKAVFLYRATATVKVEQRKPESKVLTDLATWGWGGGDFMSTELETVKSYAVMELVAYREGLINKEDLMYEHEIDGEIFKPSKKETSDKIIRKVRGLRGMVTVSQREYANLIDIMVASSTVNPTPQKDKEMSEKVARIANTIAREYKNENEYQKRKQMLSMDTLLQGMLSEYRKEIDDVKQKKETFRQKPPYVTPDKKLSLILAQISSLKVDKTDIQRQINQQEDKLKELREAKKDFEKLKVIFPEVYNHPSLATTRSNIENVEAELTELSETATEKHPQVKAKKATISKLRSKLKSDMQNIIEDTITSVEMQIASLKERLQKIEGKINEQNSRLSDTPEEITKYEELKEGLKSNQEIYTTLKNRKEEVKIASETVGEVTIIEPAIKSKPVRSGAKKLPKLLAGGVVGLLIGFVLAFVVESLDTSIGTIEDMEEYLKASVIGVIPNIGPNGETSSSFKDKLSLLKLPAWLNPFRSKWTIPTQGAPPRLVVQHDPKAPEAEAFRALRTNILLKNKNNGPMSLLVTSASPQEGKSAIASNLALAMAQLKKMTLLIDSDLRRSHLHKTFEIEKEPGLTDVIVGGVDFDEAVRSATDLLFGTLKEDFEETPGIDYLHVLPAGSRMPNPSEILNFNEVTTLINELRNQYDVVMLDTPPVLPVTDALVLASKVDGVILVYRAGKSSRMVPKRAMEVIEKNEEKIFGVVLNDVRPEIQTTASTYPYYYYYTQEKTR